MTEGANRNGSRGLPVVAVSALSIETSRPTPEIVAELCVEEPGQALAVAQTRRLRAERLAMARLETLQDAIDRAAEQAACTMVLLAPAAGVALLLGLVGVYGVVSYIVTQRTAEIGVRLALGAEPGSVTARIVRQGGMVALAGVLAGLAAALVGGRLIASLLYGVSPRDTAVFAATSITLLSVVTLACWLPARHAARISPR